MRIHIEIDELILHGFDKHNRAHIDQAIKNELDRLLIANDWLQNKVMEEGKYEFDRIDGGSFNLANDTNMSKLAGDKIAKSIYQVIGGTL